MRTAVTILILTMILHTGYGQTWKEWFRQKKTQKEYLIKQIEALQVYLTYLKKGYKIVQKGLTTVGDIKEGNFNSHKNYFQSLEQVKGFISGSPKVSGIYAFANLIQFNLEGLQKAASTSEFLTDEEKRHIKSVIGNALAECQASLSQLKNVITDTRLQMKDDERLKQIDDLYDDMKEKYAFTRAFAGSTRCLMVQREREQAETMKAGAINGETQEP